MPFLGSKRAWKEGRGRKGKRGRGWENPTQEGIRYIAHFTIHSSEGRDAGRGMNPGKPGSRKAILGRKGAVC